MITIYALIDPRDNQIKYVGQTRQRLKLRLNTHVYSYSKHPPNTYNWTKELKRINKTPIIISLEEINKNEWIEAEQFWIAYFNFIGANLLNLTKGGPGAIGHVQSEEERTKKRISNLGKKRSEQTKRNISTAKQKLMVENPELRDKYANMCRNLTRTPESYKKVSAKMKGRSISEEHKLKIRAAKAKKEGLTSNFKGVYFDKCRNKWVAKIRFNMKNYNIGRFSTEIEAAKAYDNQAFELLGEHAILNFP